MALSLPVPVFSQQQLQPPPDPQQPWHRHSSDPRMQAGYLFWFTLDETPAQIMEKLGPPRQVAELGPHYLIWQFQINVVDNHEFSHVICIRKADNKIVSVARNYEFQEIVDGLFPAKITETRRWTKQGVPDFSVRMRRLSNGRLLLAMGAEKPGDKVSQILLIRRSELTLFVPWLDESLKASDEKPATP